MCLRHLNVGVRLSAYRRKCVCVCVAHLRAEVRRQGDFVVIQQFGFLHKKNRQRYTHRTRDDEGGGG